MNGLESRHPREITRRIGEFVRRVVPFAILAIVLPILGFAGYYGYEVARTETELGKLASEKDLIESFYLVVHSRDDVAPEVRYPARKWKSPVRIFFHSSLPAWHLAQTRKRFAVLSRITGLEFRESSRMDEDHGISVFYARPRTPDAQMVREFGLRPENIGRVGQATCFTTYREGSGGTIQWGYVVFTRPADKRRTTACIVEETVQVLGLPADRGTYSPTAFTNAQARPIALSINDKILLRTLYDPAIRSGMTNEQTERLVPAIIHRLVIGVTARGEAALYQR